MMVEFVLYNPNADMFTFVSIMINIQGSSYIEQKIILNVNFYFY